jgi:hypothetical protein
MKLTREGVEFRYKGDWLVLLWPWVKHPFEKWFMSVNWNGLTFNSLKELDEWNKCVDQDLKAMEEKIDALTNTQINGWVECDEDTTS